MGTQVTEGGAADRPINALAAVTLVLVHPRRTFERLRERPHWALPLLFVIGATALGAAFAVRAGFMDEFIATEAARAGETPEAARAALLSASLLMSLVAVPLVMLLETVLYRLAGFVAGGSASFRIAFSAVAHASVPVGVGALVLACLMPFTGTARSGLNLGFILDAAAHPYLWSLLRQVDLFSLWFFVLLGIAAEPVFGLGRTRARAATLAFALFYILVMSWSGRGAVRPGM
jgi:hypothetical protein